MAGLTADTRLVIRPSNVDVQKDASFSAYTGVSVLDLVDRSGNSIQILVNTSGTTINPNADTTYDAAPINSFFVNGVVGAAANSFYIKGSATVWYALA